MKRLATHLRAMQLMMLDRPNLKRVPTGPASTDSSEWSRLIGEYDKALALMRTAYVDYNTARDAVKALPTTPEGEDYYVFKLPLLKQAIAPSEKSLEEAMTAFTTVYQRYVDMMHGTYNPHAKAA